MSDETSITLKTGKDCLRQLGLPPEEWTIEPLKFEDVPKEKRELAMMCAKCRSPVPEISDDMWLDQHNRPYCGACATDILIGIKGNPQDAEKKA